ncbi:MAG: creatininase family protein [Armatimonadota bacterium]
MPEALIWEHMTVKEVRDALEAGVRTVLVPLGVTEQHGYHLPLRTDCYNCEQISRRAAEKTGVFVAPTLAYTYSGGELPGTINVSPHVVTQVIVEILRSLCLQGLQNIILVLGHGGSENDRATQEAAEIFLRNNPHFHDRTIAVFRFWKNSPMCDLAFAEGDFHSGWFETSLLLYWVPDQVRAQYVLDEPEVVRMMREDQDAYQVRTRNVDHELVVPVVRQHPDIKVGVMGEPQRASAELGRQISDEAVGALVELIEAMQRG